MNAIVVIMVVIPFFLLVENSSGQDDSYARIRERFMDWKRYLNNFGRRKRSNRCSVNNGLNNDEENEGKNFAEDTISAKPESICLSSFQPLLEVTKSFPSQGEGR